jgi:hypothetical protein
MCPKAKPLAILPCRKFNTELRFLQESVFAHQAGIARFFP